MILCMTDPQLSEMGQPWNGKQYLPAQHHRIMPQVARSRRPIAGVAAVAEGPARSSALAARKGTST